MSDKLIVCCVLPGRRVYVAAVTDIGEALERYRRNWKVPFLPVAAYRVDPDLFRQVTGQKLGAEWSLDKAAEFFRRLPIDQGATRAFILHLDKAGDSASPLLGDWRRAVNAATSVEVAA